MCKQPPDPTCPWCDHEVDNSGETCGEECYRQWILDATANMDRDYHTLYLDEDAIVPLPHYAQPWYDDEAESFDWSQVAS